MPDRIRSTAMGILSVTSDLFYRHGIRAIGVETIAEAAETNKMTLYRHFSSKDELIAAYLRRLAEEAKLSAKPVLCRQPTRLYRTGPLWNFYFGTAKRFPAFGLRP